MECTGIDRVGAKGLIGYHEKKKDPWCAWPKTWRMRPLQHVYYPQASTLPGTLLKRRMRQINEAPKLNGITYEFLYSYDIVWTPASGQLTFFPLPACSRRSDRDILPGSERAICHCWQRHTVLLSQLSSRCNSIQLLYPLWIRGRALERGFWRGSVRVCAGMIEWDGCRVLQEPGKERNPKKWGRLWF